MNSIKDLRGLVNSAEATMAVRDVSTVSSDASVVAALARAKAALAELNAAIQAVPPPPPPPPRPVPVQTGPPPPPPPYEEQMAQQALEWLGSVAEHALCYEFKDKELLREALVADRSVPSLLTSPARSYDQGFQTLALVGDKMVDAVLLDDGLTMFDKKGDMDWARQVMSNNDNLRVLGSRCGLHNDCPQPLEGKKVADRVEALMGAIYRDAGSSLEAVRLAMWSIGMYVCDPASNVPYGLRPRRGYLVEGEPKHLGISSYIAVTEVVEG